MPDGATLSFDPGKVRLLIFAGALVVFLLAERLAPRRPPVASTARRWGANSGLMLLGAAVARLVPSMSALAAASWADAQGHGLLRLVELPSSLAVVLGIVLFDLAIYAQHVASHRFDVLWRVHRVHHADLDLDVSSGVRFHPVEILLSLVWKVAFVWLLGLPVAAVFVSEILLSSFSLFTHANIAFPKPIDAALRRLVVTPDVHRVHHSTARDESGRNFGFALLLWDRVFGTYRAEPRVEHAAMPLGLDELREPRSTASITSMLALPLRNFGRRHAPASDPTDAA